LKIEDRKRKYLIYEAHLAVAKPFYDAGYTAEDVTAFLEALNRIAGTDPKPVYLMPLIDVVKRTSAINTIDKTLQEKQAALTLMNTKLASTQGILDSMQGSLLQALQKVRTNAEKEIRIYKEQSVTEIQAFNQFRNKELLKIVEAHKNDAAALEKSFTDAMGRQNSYTQRSIDTSVKTVQAAIEALNKESTNALNTMRNLGKYEAYLNNAKILFDVLNADINLLGSIPVDVMSLLSFKLTQYLNRNYPIKTKPTPNVLRLEEYWHDGFEYSLVACSQHVTDYLMFAMNQPKPTSPR
jgi:hypothetical protein